MSKIQAFRLNKLPKTTVMYLEKDEEALQYLATDLPEESKF